ncbi:MAG TPA: hypothetical protein VFC84_11575 [Desulfosporosinus sp.]|nr:hypothetical protein [Desulfosporosinus sp.]
MADTTKEKKQVREVTNILSKQFNTLLIEKNVVDKGEKILKYHGVSLDEKIALFVLNNKLVDGRIKAGQNSSIFKKCYLLTLSDCEKKILVFTDAVFRQKFVEVYSEYLNGIETMFCPVSE